MLKKRPSTKPLFNRVYSAVFSVTLLLSGTTFLAVGPVYAAAENVSPGVTMYANPIPELTAISIAKSEYPQASTVILASASANQLFDSVLASPLSSALKAPILLTHSDGEIGAKTLRGLQQLGVKSVILVGNDAAHQATLKRQLPDGVTLQAAYGSANLNQTATALAHALLSAEKATAFSSVFVVSNALSNLSDAIAAAPAAAKNGAPILVAPPTAKASLPADELVYAETASISYLIGAVANASIPGKTVTLSGSDRSWTATYIDNQFFSSPTHLYAIDAQVNLADSATIAPLIAQNNGALVYFYAPGRYIPDGTNSFLDSPADTNSIQWLSGVGPASAMAPTYYTTLETNLRGLGNGVATMTVTASPATPKADQVVRLASTATSAKGAPVTTPVTWSISSSNSRDAAVQSTGPDSATLISIAPGTYAVTASVDGFTSKKNLSVTSAVY